MVLVVVLAGRPVEPAGLSLVGPVVGLVGSAVQVFQCSRTCF